MAVSKLWPVTVRLATVLDYASNPEKTTKSKSKYSDADYQALRDVVAYAKDGEKTERELFCEGIHCNPQTAREQFITVKEQFDKPDGIQAYHGYLSFEETDITPELAQRVGMAFAERMWGDRFQVLVTTHLNADTFKEDCFPNIKMRFVLENPPFGTPWAGKDAKAGQEDAVRNEFKRGKNGRWGAGLPSGGDSQLIFMQSAIDKMDDKVGRAAIIENGSPLFTGGTASGESQIRRWILEQEQDLLEAIIALPTDLFYNTGIATYVWILSKNKRPERKGYVQLIDATSIFHKLRKAAGNKKNELLPEDRDRIVKLYTAFEENEYCKIFKNEEFMYREYTVMQPLQRSYAITEERIDQMLVDGTLNSVYDPAKVDELEEQGAQISVKDKMKLDKLHEQKLVYEAIISALQVAASDEIYLSPETFMPVLRKALAKVTDDKKLLDKIADGLSVMDKNAEIQRDKHGAILYDKDSKDTERVPYEESIDDYMAREVLPHVPDAKAFWEEKADAKKPVIKTGAEIPFTQYFYKYEQPVPSEELAKQFTELEQSVSQRIAKLFG